MAPALETVDLTRRFRGEIAVDRLSFQADPGEVVALLGPNGAGKTTTVRLLNGVLRPDSGHSRVLGLDPATEGEALRRRTGVLTENAGLDDRLTARENLVAAAGIRGITGAEGARRITELLERFGMGPLADRVVQGFSTGQRKRVAIARALLHDPEVLFLDEPTSGLDPEATRDVEQLIAGLATEHGRTVVLCTHFLGEAGRLAHRMAVLDHGRLEAFGRPRDLADELWDATTVNIDCGAPPGDAALAAARAVAGVRDVILAPTGLVVRVATREAVPKLMATLVGHDLPVYACTPEEPTLEDVYFALLERRRASTPNGDAAEPDHARAPSSGWQVR